MIPLTAVVDIIDIAYAFMAFCTVIYHVAIIAQSSYCRQKIFSKMMLEEIIIHSLEKAVNAVYSVEPQKEMLQVQATRKEFEGDLTAVMFPYLSLAGSLPNRRDRPLGNGCLPMNPELRVSK
jgi:hypothetical protein